MSTVTISPDNIPVLVASARTPFLDSAGAYDQLMTYELAALAISGLLERVALPAAAIEQVIMGIVLHEVNTTNYAREAMLKAGLPSTIPAYTVAMAGISPTVGVIDLADRIALGRIQFGIAGGAENFSDVPLRLSQKVRRLAMKLNNAKTTGERLKLLATLRLSDLKIEAPASGDFTTGLTMGQSCENMVQAFGSTREQADAFAAESHTRAVRAQQAGLFDEQIIPVQTPYGVVTADNTPRADSTPEKLATLKPVFDREQGVITAGNASRFSDGAGAVLLGSLGAARAQGLPVLAAIRDYQLVGTGSLEQEMLLGPALSIPKVLARNGLQFSDIGVWEIHEAFASQVLINLQCMAQESFVRERFGADAPFGDIPHDKLNVLGGSVSLGNPFAATGVRLLHTAAQRLARENARYAIISTCAGGGLGAAVLLENPAYL